MILQMAPYIQIETITGSVLLLGRSLARCVLKERGKNYVYSVRCVCAFLCV